MLLPVEFDNAATSVGPGNPRNPLFISEDEHCLQERLSGRRAFFLAPDETLPSGLTSRFWLGGELFLENRFQFADLQVTIDHLAVAVD